MLKQLIRTMAIITLLIIANTISAAPLAFSPISEIPFSDVTDLNQNFALSQFSLNDSLGVLSAVSAAIDSNGQTHLVFLDRLKSQNIVLRYIRQKGETCETTIVDIVGKTKMDADMVDSNIPKYRPSIALSSDGSIHVAYIKKAGKTLHVCHSLIKNGETLVGPTLIDQAGDTSTYQIGLLVDSKKVVHVSYYNGGLKYAENSTGKFVASMCMADEVGNNFLEKGKVSEVIQLGDGTILIPYQGTHHRRYVVVAQYVDCAIYSKGKWRNTSIFGELGKLVGETIAAFVDSAGLPTVIYTRGRLGHAVYQNNKWNLKNTDMGSQLQSGGMGAILSAKGQEIAAWFNGDNMLNLSTQKSATADWLHSSVAKFSCNSWIPQERNPTIIEKKDGKLNIYVKISNPAKAVVVRIVQK